MRTAININTNMFHNIMKSTVFCLLRLEDLTEDLIGIEQETILSQKKKVTL